MSAGNIDTDPLALPAEGMERLRELHRWMWSRRKPHLEAGTEAGEQIAAAWGACAISIRELIQKEGRPA